MPFLMLFLPLLAKLPGLFGDYFTQKTQLAQAQLNAELAVEQAKITMASEIAQAQLDEEKTIVASTGAGFKYFTFGMWFGPYMLQMVWPSKGLIIFQNMAEMPAWYAQSCVAIMFTAWGISVSAPVVSGVFSSLGEFFQAKRNDKIKLKSFDKTAFYDALRHLKGTVSPSDVKTYDPILDEVNNELDTTGSSNDATQGS